jgi:N-acyl-D-amino-acid deacylase
MTEAGIDRADLVIRGARLIDGTGGPSAAGDIAVTDDRIAGLGDLSQVTGSVEIEAAGRAVAPGFIDVHTHDDRALLVDPSMTCKVSQGVTTVVAGNCGVSLAPLALDRRPPPPLDLLSDRAEGFFADFGTYLERLDAEPAAVNALCQVGHSSLRAGAMDSLDRPAGGAEIAAMRGRLERALAAGAIGLSTGLDYAPAQAAPTEEVIALAEAVGAVGGLHTTHMRNEGDRVADSLEETFAIGRAAHLPVVISHHKCAGKANHGRSPETLALIDRARREQPIGLDAYPYNAASTVLERSFIEKASRVIVTWSKARPEVAGRDLTEIAQEMGLGPFEAADALQPAGGIFFTMDEEDVRRILAYPQTMIGSDGLPHDEFPHLSAGARPLRARGRAVPARGGRAQDDRPLRRALRPGRPRCAQARRHGRPGAVRSGDRDRHGQLRGAEDAGGRHRPRRGQWPRGLARRRNDRHPPRPGDQAPGPIGPR